jgi:multiple sugar transport system substrate-binding protein
MEDNRMPITKSGLITRRSLLKSTAAAGAALAVGTGAVPLVNIRRAYAQNLPNPADVLAKINVGNMVKKEYREQYKLGDNDELWDPKKDWIRNVDWEAVRKEHAGKTVRFAIGAADRESAQDQIEPFAQLSGIKIELVAIPDDSMYDKVVA